MVENHVTSFVFVVASSSATVSYPVEKAYSMSCAIAVFAKTIGLSAVKTRLAADIGIQSAEAFYALSIEAVREVLQMAQSSSELDISPHWVLAEEEAPKLAQWSGFPALWTGEGGLGDRLAQVSSHLFETHEMVMFVGTDSPQLSPAVFDEAIRLALANPDDCIAGPADDGGFYLFVSKNPVDANIWKSVSYSLETTLQELVSKIEDTGRQVHYLSSRLDVDTADELQKLKVEFKQNKLNLLPAQDMLLQWIEANAHWN